MIIYLGFNKKINKTKAYKVILKYFDSFSAFEVDGFYKNKQVKTLRVEIHSKSFNQGNKLRNDLQDVFRQKEVLLVFSH